MAQAIVIDRVAIAGLGLPDFGWVAEERPWSTAAIEEIILQRLGTWSLLEQRQAAIYLPSIMEHCRKAKIEDARYRATKTDGTRIKQFQIEFADLAKWLNAVAATSKPSISTTSKVAARLDKLDKGAWDQLERSLNNDLRVRRSGGRLISQADAANIDLPLLIDIVERILDEIKIAPGSPGHPTDRLLVQSLFNLWRGVTGKPPRRMFDATQDQESGQFLKFCRSVLELVEASLPFNAPVLISKRLSKIVLSWRHTLDLSARQGIGPDPANDFRSLPACRRVGCLP